MSSIQFLLLLLLLLLSPVHASLPLSSFCVFIGFQPYNPESYSFRTVPVDRSPARARPRPPKDSLDRLSPLCRRRRHRSHSIPAIPLNPSNKAKYCLRMRLRAEREKGLTNNVPRARAWGGRTCFTNFPKQRPINLILACKIPPSSFPISVELSISPQPFVISPSLPPARPRPGRPPESLFKHG